MLFDAHYMDQAQDYVDGRYRAMHLDAEAVKQATRSVLLLQPVN